MDELSEEVLAMHGGIDDAIASFQDKFSVPVMLNARLYSLGLSAVRDGMKDNVLRKRIRTLVIGPASSLNTIQRNLFIHDCVEAIVRCREALKVTQV